MGVSRRLIQRFEVLEQLGSGGMGTVYKAWDPQLERDVAIKVLAEGTRDPTLELSSHETLDLRSDAPRSQDDLLSEARMMARLSHPNVLPVYEVGLADGSVFVVMEHIAGSNLREWLEREPRERAQIISVFSQAGRGLAAAHQSGIVHRDFKPENVLIGTDGRARVADFGLSRLTAPSSALIRIDDGRGTPRYMAPELWRGETATVASDVYAFATALVEALGGDTKLRTLHSRLRHALVAAMNEESAKRPPLSAIVDALDGPRISRRWIAGGAAMALAVGVTAVVFALHSDEPSCVDETALWKGRWDAAAHDRMKELVTHYPGVAADEIITRMISTLDERKTEITGALRGTCRARRRAEITDAQYQTRASCAERRAIEVGVLVQWMHGTKLEVGELENKVSAIPLTSDCVEMVTLPLPEERAPVIALYERFMAVWNVAAYPERIRLLAQIQQDAAAMHETELELRAELVRGVYQRLVDDIAGADRTIQEVYQRALDIHASDIAVVALLERSVELSVAGNATEASSLSELAVAQAEKPGISVRTRARAYQAKGNTLVDRGDYRDAAMAFQRSLDVIRDDGHRLNMIELGVRIRLIDTLVAIEERAPASVELARDTVEFTRRNFGEHYVDYGTALNKLAYALTTNGDPAGALDYRRKAIAVLTENLGPEQSAVVTVRTALAADLWGLGEYEEARKIWADAIELSNKNETLRPLRAGYVASLGSAQYQLGQFTEGLATLQRGIDEMSVQHGLDHHWTQMYKRDLAQYQIEVGRLAEAERTIAALEQSYQRKSDSRDVDLARLHGFVQAQLELARHRPAVAEKLTRSAIEAWDELHGDKLDRWSFWLTLATSLADQQRWTEADAALAKAREVVPATPADAAARIDAKSSRVLFALGRREDALAAARRAHDALAKFPADREARTDADFVLAHAGR